jgi:RNA polymerase sigma factor (sigma-70 family)
MESVVEKLQDGDYESFNFIFNNYWNKVYMFLLKKTKNIEIATELTQIVFIKLWRYRATVSCDLPIEQQLFRKSRQVFIDWLRTESKMRDRRVELDVLDGLCNSENDELRLTLKYDLYKAIDSLPRKRKEIFEMKHIQGFSYKEIADSLGISVKTVDNQLSKANIQLRKILHLSIVATIINQCI